MADLPDPTQLSAFIGFFLSLFELGGKLWGFGTKIWRGFANEGIYEVLDYESTLELLDPKGNQAKIHKRMVVRFLQENTTSFQDFRWANGKIENYRITPGYPVDEYQSGYLTYILVSLRTNKNKGDTEEFNIEWEIKDGFKKRDGYWQTDVSNKFRGMTVNVIFPKNRPPKRAFVEVKNRRNSTPIDRNSFKQLPDGRWQITWRNQEPKLFESYILRWEW